jgi:hypothetical protein
VSGGQADGHRHGDRQHGVAHLGPRYRATTRPGELGEPLRDPRRPARSGRRPHASIRGISGVLSDLSMAGFPFLRNGRGACPACLGALHLEREKPHCFLSFPPTNRSRQSFSEMWTSYLLAAARIRSQARSRSSSVTPFHLVEARYRVPHVRRIGEGFFAFGGKGELRDRQAILFRRAQAFRATRNVFSVSTLALDLTSLLDVAPCRLFCFSVDMMCTSVLTKHDCPRSPSAWPAAGVCVTR